MPEKFSFFWRANDRFKHNLWENNLLFWTVFDQDKKYISDSVLILATLPLQLVFVLSFVILFVCVFIFPNVLYLYLSWYLYLRMMREGDFCLVGGDIAATIWGQYFSEIRGPVRFTKYFTTLYNIFQYFTIWGKYFWEITGIAACALYTLCKQTTSFLPRIIFAQYSFYHALSLHNIHHIKHKIHYICTIFFT